MTPLVIQGSFPLRLTPNAVGLSLILVLALLAWVSVPPATMAEAPTVVAEPHGAPFMVLALARLRKIRGS
jgi:hypothetical protein